MFGHACGRGMGAVGGGEGVIDIDVAEGGQLVGKAIIIVGLARMETQVLQHDDVASRHVGNCLFGSAANAISGKADRTVHGLAEGFGNRAQALLGINLALGATEMRHDHDLGTGTGQFAQGRC